MSARTKRLVLGASLLAILIAGVLVWRRATPPAPRTEATAEPVPRAAPRLAAVPHTEASAFVEGTVRDRGGRPLGSATVVVVAGAGSLQGGGPPIAALALTGSDGRFRLGPLAPGHQQIDAAAPGHLPAGHFVQLDEGQTVRDLVLVLEPGGEVLSGRVLDASGGPIPGARVRGQPGGGSPKATMFAGGPPRELPAPTEVGAVTVADGQGQYRLTVPRGSLSITAEADGYVPGRAFLVLLAGPKTHDFHLIPATTIAGRVVRKGTGAPVPGAKVRVRGGRVTLEFEGAPDGSFLAGPLDPGSYQLLASAGPLAGRSSAPVLARLATRVDGVVIEVDRARTVTGHVRRTGGEPVKGAQVDLYGLEMHATARSDAGGAFRLEGLVAGSYSLSAIAFGVGAAERRVTIADRDLDGVDLILDRTATVSGRVVDELGQPCPDVTVTLEMNSGDEDSFDREEARQAAGGRFSFGELPPGVVTLRAEDLRCGRGRLAMGKLGPGEKREVTLRLSTQGRLVRGLVRWSDGRPASGIEVTGMNLRSDNDRARATTGADGRYQLGPYPAGALVMVEPEATAVEPAGGKRTVRLDEGDATGADFTLVRSGGEIRGVVLGPDGRPLAGAIVRVQSTRLVTGPDGVFAFTGLPAGEHDLFAEYAGLPGAAARRVASGRTDVRISLRRGALLAGVVEGVSGRGAGLCWVMALPAGDNRGAVAARTVCGEGATFELPGLLAGTYDLTATTADGREGGLPQVLLSEGQEKRGLRLPLATRLAVVGRIVDLEAQRPLAGAKVRASGEKTSAEAVSDAAGKFRLEGAFRGLRLDYTIEAPGYVKNHLERSAPMSGDTFDLGVIPLLAERKGPATGRAGIVLGQGDDGSIVVNDTIADLPAAKAGLRRGDVIVAIDGHPLENIDLLTAVSMIRGQPGTPLTLDVRQPDAKPRRLRFVRG